MFILIVSHSANATSKRRCMEHWNDDKPLKQRRNNVKTTLHGQLNDAKALKQRSNNIKTMLH